MAMKGIASDIEQLSGGINRALQPVQEKIERERLDRAAKLVLERRGKVEDSK